MGKKSRQVSVKESRKDMEEHVNLKNENEALKEDIVCLNAKVDAYAKIIQNLEHMNEKLEHMNENFVKFVKDCKHKNDNLTIEVACLNEKLEKHARLEQDYENVLYINENLVKKVNNLEHDNGELKKVVENFTKKDAIKEKSVDVCLVAKVNEPKVENLLLETCNSKLKSGKLHESMRQKPKFDKKNIVCFCCHEKGHFASQCSKKQKPMLNMKNVECFCCHEVGHLAKACPKKQMIKLQKKNHACYCCNGLGHIAKHCLKRKVETKPKSKKVWNCMANHHGSERQRRPHTLNDYFVGGNFEFGESSTT